MNYLEPSDTLIRWLLRLLCDVNRGRGSTCHPKKESASPESVFLPELQRCCSSAFFPVHKNAGSVWLSPFCGDGVARRITFVGASVFSRRGCASVNPLRPSFFTVLSLVTLTEETRVEKCSSCALAGHLLGARRLLSVDCLRPTV
ncbi:hypothetical protein TGRUB_309180 [Toxoplasma gondii RUB]|uniref:Uncharacterized protein n=1 Tax=Toxoplasma gondii RUB TaxID=935652 RepID=A0A086LM97_TOXGO|nr:hypothetical protein TGRUB_309180 [Toxoplasma gondii RUB]